MRIAATADLHFTPQRYGPLRDELNKVRDEADVLVVAGDLTNYGKPEEMEPLVNVLVRLRVPVIAVLGNHDYECDKQDELVRMMTAEGMKVLDGSAYERDGVGFAGTKGFVGGFGRGLLTAFGEPEVKTFVRAGIDEALKLERAMSHLRTTKRVVVLHYSPIADTVEGRLTKFIHSLVTRVWPRWLTGTAQTWCYTDTPTMESPMEARRLVSRCTMSRSLCYKRKTRQLHIACLISKQLKRRAVDRTCSCQCAAPPRPHATAG